MSKTPRAKTNAEELDARDFKQRNARVVAGLIEAANDVLMKKIQAGNVTFLDWKFLHEVHAQLNGEAGAIIEMRHTLPALASLNEAFAAASAMLTDEKMRDVTPQKLEAEPHNLPSA